MRISSSRYDRPTVGLVADSAAEGEGAWCRGLSGNNIGQQDVLELDDAVLETELPLFHALDEHLVGDAGGLQGVDGGVEVGVFLAFAGQFSAKSNFLFLGERQHRASRFQQVRPEP